jgi:hypothetical protein
MRGPPRVVITRGGRVSCKNSVYIINLPVLLTLHCPVSRRKASKISKRHPCEKMSHIRSRKTKMKCCGSRSGIQCFFDPWVRDPGWKKSRSRIRDLHSAINIMGHISKSVVKLFGLKMLKFCVTDPDPGWIKSRSWNCYPQ